MTQQLSDLEITTSTIDSTSIGANSPSTGEFNYVSSSGPFVQCETETRAYDIATRDALPNFPVPSFRPKTANTVIAVDIMPNGTPAENTGNGYAWIDICAQDVRVGNPLVHGARLAATSKGARVASFNYNGASQKSLSLGIGSTDRWFIDATGYQFAPTSDNAQALCSAGLRSSVVFSGTGVISTSDAREKQDISTIPDEWLDAWGDVQHVAYRWISSVEEKGENARWHVGHIAQQVKEAFDARGIDALKIGLLCYDEWEDDEENGVKAGNRYGLRADQCNYMEAAYMRREIKRLKEK